MYRFQSVPALNDILMSGMLFIYASKNNQFMISWVVVSALKGYFSVLFSLHMVWVLFSISHGPGFLASMGQSYLSLQLFPFLNSHGRTKLSYLSSWCKDTLFLSHQSSTFLLVRIRGNWPLLPSIISCIIEKN